MKYINIVIYITKVKSYSCIFLQKPADILFLILPIDMQLFPGGTNL